MLEKQIIGKLKIYNPWWTYGVMPKYYTDMTPRLYLDIFLPITMPYKEKYGYAGPVCQFEIIRYICLSQRIPS